MNIQPSDLILINDKYPLKWLTEFTIGDIVGFTGEVTLRAYTGTYEITDRWFNGQRLGIKPLGKLEEYPSIVTTGNEILSAMYKKIPTRACLVEIYKPLINEKDMRTVPAVYLPDKGVGMLLLHSEDIKNLYILEYLGGKLQYVLISGKLAFTDKNVFFSEGQSIQVIIEDWRPPVER